MGSSLSDLCRHLQRVLDQERWSEAEVIVSLGASLEGLLDVEVEASPLLTRWLEVLQALYGGDASAVSTLALSVGMVREVLEAGGSLDIETLARAQVLLDGPPQSDPLDDAAVLLATMDIADSAAWEALRSRLERASVSSDEIDAVVAGDLSGEAARSLIAGRIEAAQRDPFEDDEPLPRADAALLADFVAESRDLIEKAESALLDLEVEPDDVEAINVVFRAFHTVKGTGAFVGLAHLSELAHHAESLFSRMRDREIRCCGSYATLALQAVDMVKSLIGAVAAAGSEEPLADGFHELLERLQQAADGPVIQTDSEPGPVEEPLKPADAQPRGAQAAESSVRVRTDRLDRLVEAVSELVIGHSMLAQDPTVLTDGQHELLRKVTQNGKILRELQDISMAMRMVPLKGTFQKMARLVRDLAHRTGKSVRLVTCGEETEIDRNMVDVLSEPLVHMIRNAIDHGIELPAGRTASGKPAAGTITLSASHSGGHVVVELRDDGRGLDRDRILQKALARGLVESERGLADVDIYGLIFEPGFSTVDRVTDVSGRGVGMDVVRQAIESLRGRIDIGSTKGDGCVFTLRLPLTLAITDGMLVSVGGERYILPTSSIVLSFRPERAALSTVTGRGEMVMLRGELMPLYRLHQILDVRGAVRDPIEGLLIVLTSGARRYSLLVDQLLGQQQVVAKSIGDLSRNLSAISGAAILGDGRVGLILDPDGVAQAARTTRPTLSHSAAVTVRKEPLHVSS